MWTGFLGARGEWERCGCKIEAFGFCAIQGGGEGSHLKVYCQNWKIAFNCLQLEDSEVQELLFLLIRLFYELQITACMLSAHSQCLSARGKLHHSAPSLHWAGISMSSIIHITACCSYSWKISKERNVLLSWKGRQDDFPMWGDRKLGSQREPPPRAHTLCLSAA